MQAIIKENILKQERQEPMVINLPDNRLRIAVQKSGKLSEGCFDLFKKCSLDLRVAKNQFLVKEETLSIDFMLVRDDDIPGFLENGVCDMGIIGENLLREYELNNPSSKLEVVLPLGFSKCRLSLAAPIDSAYQKIADLNGAVIATSYPEALKKFLDEQNINAKIVTMHGSVELAPKIGVADVICDLVSSGATLAENGLTEIVTILKSQAVLVGTNKAFAKFKQENAQRLMARMKGVIEGSKSKYIMMHIDRKMLDKIPEILPGCESPTVLELQGTPDKVAIHVVSPENVFWQTIEKLKAIGASAILVLPIEKMME